MSDSADISDSQKGLDISGGDKQTIQTIQNYTNYTKQNFYQSGICDMIRIEEF